MTKLERLEGGFINEVYRTRFKTRPLGSLRKRAEFSGTVLKPVHKTDDTVIKYFTGENLVGISPYERCRRERYALARFGGQLAPQLKGYAEKVVIQEFIQGRDPEKLVNTYGYKTFEECGRLLSKIHQPVCRNPEYLKENIEKIVSKNLCVSQSILQEENIVYNSFVNWPKVWKLGTTRVHRDFWLGNIKNIDSGWKAIDWEFAGIGTPYEDFAIVELWIFKEYEKRFPKCRELFWQGYGDRPDEKIIQEFLKIKCIGFLATTNLNDYQNESKDGFYHNKITVLKELL